MSNSKILDLIRKVKEVAPAIEDEEQSEDLLRLAEESKNETLEDILANIATRQTVIVTQESLMMVIEKFLPDRPDLVLECEKAIRFSNISINLYKELYDEISGS